MIIYSKNIYLEDKKISGFIKVKDSIITDIAELDYELTKDYLSNYIVRVLGWEDDEEIIDYSDFIIIPGFIDNHIHGWGTGSFWFEKTAESILEMQKHLPKTGVTSFLPTTVTDDLEELLKAIDEANKIYESKQKGAEMLGLHLEGPFISKEYRGMQKEESCIAPNLDIMKAFYNRQKSKDLIKLMTMAPELDGAKEVAEFCREKGIQLSIGHSGASFDKIKEMKKYGFSGFTHTFSGMKGFHHRELGVAGAALYFDDMYCEFAKQTGLTVKHEAFDIALRIKTSDKIILSTDCSGLAKTNKPFHHYIRKITLIPNKDGLMIKHADGKEEIIDNSLYENVKDIEMGYIDSVKNIIKHSKVDIFDIIKMASINPAKYINVFDRKGSIAVNKDADLLIIDNDFNLIYTIIRGEIYF